MTILLLFLLVVYFAVVSAPISIRLVGLVLARTKSSELPLPWRSATLSARGGALKAAVVQSVTGLDATAGLGWSLRTRTSKEEAYEQAILSSTEKKTGHLLAEPSPGYGRGSFPRVQFECLRRGRDQRRLLGLKPWRGKAGNTCTDSYPHRPVKLQTLGMSARLLGRRRRRRPGRQPNAGLLS